MSCRGAVAAVLLVLLALEILPCSFQATPIGSCEAAGGLACRFEPLQVCDDGSSSLGVLAEHPVLVTGIPVLIVSPAFFGLVPEGGSFAREGVRPAVDRPPRLSA